MPILPWPTPSCSTPSASYALPRPPADPLARYKFRQIRPVSQIFSRSQQMRRGINNGPATEHGLIRPFFFVEKHEPSGGQVREENRSCVAMPGAEIRCLGPAVSDTVTVLLRKRWLPFRAGGSLGDEAGGSEEKTVAPGSSSAEILALLPGRPTCHFAATLRTRGSIPWQLLHQPLLIHSLISPPQSVPVP